MSNNVTSHTYIVKRITTMESAGLELLNRMDNNIPKINETLETDNIIAKNMLKALGMALGYVSAFLATNDQVRVTKQPSKNDIYNSLRSENKAIIAVVRTANAYVYFRLYQKSDGVVYQSGTPKKEY